MCCIVVFVFFFFFLLSSFYFLFFFFFQAEDGIRDLTVTGVQTCALPIWVPLRKLNPVSFQHGQEERRDGDSALLVLQQGPERRPQADRGPDGLYLRRVCRGLQRHHRGRQPL